MLTPYKKSDMVYTDYKWQAQADHDNPKIIAGTDHTELNRSEGYEMLYFISSLAKTWGWENYPLSSYQHLEKIIKTEVPSSIRTHSGIRDWIASKYQNI
jgi:hypothetical protein